MDRTVLIEKNWNQVRIAVIENEALSELHILKVDASAPGQFFRGKVLRVDHSLNAAFVEIGEALPGFLPGVGKRYRQGDTIIVQAAAIPSTETKGIRLTDKFEIAGESLVLLPGQSGVRISQKISEYRRNKIKPVGERLCPDGFGLIMRSCWESNVKHANLEVEDLLSRWKDIRVKYTGSLKPGKLTENGISLDGFKSLFSGAKEIFCNDETLTKTIQEMLTDGNADRFPENLENSCKISYKSEQTSLLFDLYRVDSQIDRALDTRLWLKSGAYLTVDYCEAFTVYDVNSGKNEKKLPKDEKALAIDLEAIETIMRHIRLCNLGGIILVDLIDLGSDDMRKAVLEKASELSKRDRIPVHIEGITSLGILQLTRKRTELPLSKLLLDTCPECQKRGMILKPEVTADRICRDILRRRMSGQQSGYRITCHRKVAEILKADPTMTAVSCSYKTDQRRIQGYTVESMPNTPEETVHQEEQ